MTAERRDSAAFIVHRYRSHRECAKIKRIRRATDVFWNRWSASRSRRHNHARGEKRVSRSGPRTSLSVRCYWPRIDGTLRLRFNIFNELAYQRENRVETVAPPRAEYLLLPLSAGNVDRITHRSLNSPLTRFAIYIYVNTERTLFANKDRWNFISKIALDKRKRLEEKEYV